MTIRTILSRVPWVDIVLALGLAGLLCGLFGVGQEWFGNLHEKVAIDLSPASLPGYTLLSLTRGMLAYALSLGFTLVYAYWAAKHRPSGLILVPLLDILQSIPVLGFMPALVVGLIAVFPQRNVGLELAAVLMIFTGQAWNMTFSFYRSLTSLPTDQEEAARVFHFSWWQRLRWVELPAATSGLVWNSMMSMAGGWFFLMLSETFVLGEHDYRLPGLGSYMQAALTQGNWLAMGWGVLAMVLMIVVLDQILWRPLVVWAERFRVEDSAAAVVQESWFLDVLHDSRLVRWCLETVGHRRFRVRKLAILADDRAVVWGARLAWVAFALLLSALTWGAWLLVGLLIQVPFIQVPLVQVSQVVAAGGSANDTSWLTILQSTGLTAARVLGSLVLGTLWALPAGLAIGRSPTWSRRLQPVVQVAASFPAPMLFPLFLMLFHVIGLPLGTGAMILMLLGTQWYILFNVIAGAQAIPSDLREASLAFRMSPWQRFRSLEAPAVLPALVIGWITAAGGAWNASIVAEYLSWQDTIYAVDGLGSTISRAAAAADYPALAASVTCMAVTVVLINVMCWRPLRILAHDRFSSQ